MQQNVLIKNPCRQAHQRGQETVNSVCLNKDCLIKLACQNCLIEGQHKDHQASVCHFDHLRSRFNDEILQYKNAGIRNLINQKKQKFSEFKSNILKALTILENEAMENVEEVDQQVGELIQMTETNNYSLLKESHCKCLVALKDDLSSSLQRKLNLKIQEELMNILIYLQGISREGDKFLKDNINIKDELGIQGFKNYRLKYNQRNVEEINMIPIIEEQVKVLDKSGSIYFGSVKNNNIKHGRGIEIKYNSSKEKTLGDIYEGLWLNDTLKWGQKMMRISYYSNVYLITDIIQQKEKVSWRYTNGDEYVGEYEQYIKHGKGIYKYSNGDKYEGEYKDDKKEGKGTYFYSNGDRYEGEYIDDKKHGNGTYFYSNGEKYEGDYKNDKKEGYGKYYYKNGDKYEGYYKDDKKEGKGKYYYKNGDSQTESFTDDKKKVDIFEYVIFHYPNGDRYEGEYKNDKKEGYGKYYYKNGDKYEGYYKDDKKEGRGTYYYKNGDRYEGYYLDDKKEGNGTYKYSNGDEAFGNYLNDLPIGAHILYKNNSSKSIPINYGEDGKVKDCNIF